MALIVEDGTGVADANSYVSLDDCADYCTEQGLTFPASPSLPAEQAIVRATRSLDAQYESKYPGTRTFGRDQSLGWPRHDIDNSSTGDLVTDTEGNTIEDEEIPIEIVRATCELAARELTEAQSTMPDLDRSILSEKAGPVSITFAANAREQTVFPVVDGILAPLIGGGGAGSLLFGTAIRG